MSDNTSGKNAGGALALMPNPNTSADWSQDDPAHHGFVVDGLDDTPGQKAYYIHMEAKPGKEELLQDFLRDINAGVDQEPLTGPWFALRYSKTTFCIFEAFPDAQARHAHDNGPGGHNFLRSELLQDMLAYPAQLYRLDVLHGKFGVMLGKPVTIE
jgi:quinol monooxygenase YgiN